MRLRDNASTSECPRAARRTVILKLSDGKTVSFKGTDGVNSIPKYHEFAVTLFDYVEQRNRLSLELAARDWRVS